MSRQDKLLTKVARYLWFPLAWASVVVYMTFETLWEVVSDWVFSYTPLQVFSERIHQRLEGRSEWLVLLVYLAHFALMQAMAVMSGKMFLQGFISWGVAFYVLKGLVAIPTLRFFVQEKERLLNFWPLRIAYGLVIAIKSSKPYRYIASWAIAIKERFNALIAEAFKYLKI